ncbi:MAG TPA: universal stress protein [Mycobacteriales bacterium]|nr:universal stress protein [Mycobacteriales bacterium]
MASLLAFTETPAETSGVKAVTTALAQALHLDTDEHRLPVRPADLTAFVLEVMDDPQVRMAVLPYSAGHAARLVNDVIQRCSKPVVIVPIGRRAQTPRAIDRILVPLDGTVESADTVGELVALFAASGTDIVVLHVFDATNVPMFWDQPVHARESWVGEFLHRYCDQPNVRMELRSGAAGEHIIDVAATEHADLIALGWAQNLAAGRARAVRATIAAATIPVLLLPIPADTQAVSSGMTTGRTQVAR